MDNNLQINPIKFADIQLKHYRRMLDEGFEDDKALELTDQFLRNICILQAMMSNMNDLNNIN